MEQRTHVMSDANGNFSFAGVDPGLHELVCLGREGELARSKYVSVGVPSGSAGVVELDLVDAAFTPARIRLLRDGRPLAGAELSAYNLERQATFDSSLGQTDEQGVVEGVVAGTGSLRVSVSLSGQQFPSEALEPIPYQAGVPVDATLEIQLSKLTLVLPPSVSMPTEGNIHLWLHSDSTPFGQAQIRLPVSDGRLSDVSPQFASLEGQTLTYLAFVRGGGRVSLEVTSSALGKRELREVPAMTILNERWPSVFEAVFDVDCSTGACGPIQLGQ
jgi:hypothetical protein